MVVDVSEEEPLGFCLVDVDLVDPGSQVGSVGVGVVIKQIQIVNPKGGVNGGSGLKVFWYQGACVGVGGAG